MKKYINFSCYWLCIVMLLASCQNELVSGARLSGKDRDFLHSMHILGTDEIVFNFYSEYRHHVSGSFYTDLRIASYWMDERSRLERKTESAFYRDISHIDTVLNRGLSYCPYMLVTRSDSSVFKAYFDGDKEMVRSAFNQAMSMWKYHRFKEGRP